LKHPSQSCFEPSTIVPVLERSLTQAGYSIADLSSASPVLVVFLRHGGCIFCREALRDIARSRHSIEQRGTRIVLVHMGESEIIERALRKYKLSLIDRICDPMQELYRAFGLNRGTLLQLFGWKVLWRSMLVGPLHGFHPKTADASQMPGVFLIERSTIIRRFRHRTAADRPDYRMLCDPIAG
jgi:peroxiredoxin